MSRTLGLVLIVALHWGTAWGGAAPAEKFTTIYSARVLAQALPWIAEEAKLFHKHNLDHNLVFVASSSIVTAALLAGGVEVACLTPPTDVQALSRGYHYVIYGPDLKIPYAATSFVTKRSTVAKRPQAMAQYMRAMAEASKIMHTDREFVYRVLGKQLRLNDRTILESAYNAEIKVMEPRLALKADAFQAILDEVAQNDERAKKVKPQEMTEPRFLNDMEKSGFFDQLWAKR